SHAFIRLPLPTRRSSDVQARAGVKARPVQFQAGVLLQGGDQAPADKEVFLDNHHSDGHATTTPSWRSRPARRTFAGDDRPVIHGDRKSTRLNSSHVKTSY